MALITLLLLLLFSALALRPTLSNPPQWLAKITDEAEARIDPLAMYTLVYGLVAIFLAAFFVHGTLDIVTRFFANIMLVLLALPAGAEQLTVRFSNRGPDDTNDAIMESLQDILAGLARNQALLGWVGVGAAVLLFAVMFR